MNNFDLTNTLIEFQSRGQEFEKNLESVYKPNKIALQYKTHDNNVIHPIKLKFKSELKEQEYNLEKARVYQRHYKIYLSIYNLVHITMFVYVAISENLEIWVVSLLYLSSLILFICFVLQFTQVYMDFTFDYINIFYILCQFFTIQATLCLVNTFSITFVLYPLFFIVSFAHW